MPHRCGVFASLSSSYQCLIPKETALLHNYPNPFNPETWIPYQLASPADILVSIYTTDGKLVRTLDLGYQPIGIYQGKSRAAYWDGKNEIGESVRKRRVFLHINRRRFHRYAKNAHSEVISIKFLLPKISFTDIYQSYWLQ